MSAGMSRLASGLRRVSILFITPSTAEYTSPCLGAYFGSPSMAAESAASSARHAPHEAAWASTSAASGALSSPSRYRTSFSEYSLQTRSDILTLVRLHRLPQGPDRPEEVRLHRALAYPQ